MMEWNVRIETASPDDLVGRELEAAQAAFDELLGKLEAYGPAGGLGPDGWNLVVTIDVAEGGHAPLHAVDQGTSLVMGAAAAVGLPYWKIVELCAVESELEWARNEEPTFPDVVGVQEVLGMLGVTKQRLSQLRQAGRFPEPMVELGATPVWLRSGIEGFMAVPRPAGRPATDRQPAQ